MDNREDRNRVDLESMSSDTIIQMGLLICITDIYLIIDI